MVAAQEGKGQWLSFAQQGNAIIGMAGAFTPESPNIADIISVYVAKEIRGQGIGKRLMTHLISSIKQNPDIKTLHLEVNSTQPSAMHSIKAADFGLSESSKEYWEMGRSMKIL
ncbi:hypothetical protein BH11PAT1_BH11PAT1_2560 [soil metagenome]